MKKLALTITVFILLGLPSSILAHLPTDQSTARHSIAPMLEKITPAVVNVYVEEKIRTAR